MHFYEPRHGHRLPHDPFKAIVAPRPIGWISTLSLDGVANLAPYSFFAPISDDPPILMFASQGWKDTIANIEATGEFIWNMVSGDLGSAMNISAAPAGAGIDEFELAGLEKGPARIVRVPRVAASPASMECSLLEIRRVVCLDDRVLDRWTITGQVVGVHIGERYLLDGIFDTARTAVMARAGYRDEYFTVSSNTKISFTRPQDEVAHPYD